MVDQLSAGVITSLPSGNCNAATASRLAEDPELTISPCRLPKRAATRLSKLRTAGPSISRSGCSRITVAAASISSGP